MKIAKIGLDLSMNSSGLALNYTNDDLHVVKFFQICPSEIKVSGDVQLVKYKRLAKIDQYSTDDLITVMDASSLANCIGKHLTKLQAIYKFDTIDIRMEGSIMKMSKFGSSSKGRLNDLTVFNSTTKRMLLAHPLISSITIIPPTSLKKSFTGKGNAKKEVMIAKFMTYFPKFDITRKVKIDDIVDAYGLSLVDVKDSDKFFKV